MLKERLIAEEFCLNEVELSDGSWSHNVIIFYYGEGSDKIECSSIPCIDREAAVRLMHALADATNMVQVGTITDPI